MYFNWLIFLFLSFIFNLCWVIHTARRRNVFKSRKTIDRFTQVLFHLISHFFPQVTVENFLRVLTGRIPSSTPRSKRLLSDDRSNILIYMTGNFQFRYLMIEYADSFSERNLYGKKLLNYLNYFWIK